MLQYIEKNSFGIVTNRLWWFTAFLLSIGIIPVGLITGVIYIFIKNLRTGVETIGYSFLVGLSCMFITATSVIVPSYGASKTWKQLIDINDLHARHATDEKENKPLIHTNRGKIDVTLISSEENKSSDRYLIAFPGAGHLVQDLEAIEHLEYLSKKLNCSILSPNYPGTTTKSNYKISSSDDCSNIGIAIVNYLMFTKHWSLTKIAQNVVLFGYSMGGMVAFNVAHHFKTIHGIDVQVFADRSPKNLNKSAANNYTRSTHLPEWYMIAFHYPVFKAANINFRAEELYSSLNCEKVACLNVENDPAVPKGYGIANLNSSSQNMRYFTCHSVPKNKTPHHVSPRDLIETTTGMNGMDFLIRNLRFL